MFIHDGYVSPKEPVGVSANLTLDYYAWNYFRSDEQPLWLDFKTHYEADWERGIFNQRIPGAPITFSISGGPFGNRTTPTNYTGFGQGYRADSSGWTSLAYVQQSGAMGDWRQVQWNSSLDIGSSILGGYEEIVWNAISNSHDIVGQYAYTNTSLPVGDYEITGYLNPTLASEWPWPYVYGDETDTFSIRCMHRMYVEAEIIVSAHNPVYYYDNTQFTGSGYGAWRALFSESGLVEAGYDTDMSGDISTQEFSAASIGKPYAQLWDGTPSTLIDESAKLRPFLRAN